MFEIGNKLTKENYTKGAVWCNANGCVINPDTWVIETIPKQTLLTYEQVKQIRASLYASKVDTLMSEYIRKKTFGLFDEGEEAELLAKIEAKVEDIKAKNPYPVEE